MKQISIFIAIALIIAAVVFFMRDRTARQELAAAQKQVNSLSNEVNQVKTIMAMLSVTNNELGQQITKQLDRITGISNRFAKVTEDLKQAQQEHTTVRSELEKQTKRAADSEQVADKLENEVRSVRNTLQNSETQVEKLTASLKLSDADLAALRARLQKAEADVVRLQLDMNDETALRAQLTRLERQWPPVGFARPPKSGVTADEKGAKSLTTRFDRQAKGYYLEIQADGTVKLVPSFEAAGSSAK